MKTIFLVAASWIFGDKYNNIKLKIKLDKYLMRYFILVSISFVLILYD